MSSDEKVTTPQAGEDGEKRDLLPVLKGGFEV